MRNNYTRTRGIEDLPESKLTIGSGIVVVTCRMARGERIRGESRLQEAKSKQESEGGQVAFKQQIFKFSGTRCTPAFHHGTMQKADTPVKAR